MAFELVQEEGSMPIHNDTSSQVSQPTTDTAITQTTQTSPSTSASSLPHHEESLTAKSASSTTSHVFSYPAVDFEAIQALRALSQSNSSRSSVSTPRTSSPEKRPTANHAGHKRTATGELVSPVTGAQSSPWHGHSRHSSMISNASTVTELTQNLRPFLSYAKVKVDNGWERNTIHEVESLASQHASPRPVAPGSPRLSWNSPPGDWSARATVQRPWQDGGASKRTGNTGDRVPVLRSHAALQKSLAPAVEGHIKPDPEQGQSYLFSPKRAGPTNGVNLGLGVPSIPERRRAHPHQPAPAFKQRTPSQTKAMEEEALETLMFMSSPGNSQQYRSRAATLTAPSSQDCLAAASQSQSQSYSRPQTSPLRQAHPNQISHSSRSSHSRSESLPVHVLKRREEDLDQLLDSMEDPRERDRLPSEEVEFLKRNGLDGLVDSVR